MKASGPYFIGRPHVQLKKPWTGVDKTFAAERLDGKKINSPNYQHCTFANLSFKEAELSHGTFEYCIFIDCYFRRTELRNSRFVGCQFHDCNFNHVKLKSCDFRYSTFHGCQISFDEIKYCFPREPNLCEQLARNLSIESTQLGLAQEAKNFRRAQIKAHEDHLYSAFSGANSWYKEHFDFLRRTKALAQLTASLLNRWLWGYGDRAGVLVFNFAVLSLLFFPLLFFFVRDHFLGQLDRQITFLDTVLFSLENVIPAGIESKLYAASITTQLLAGLESVCAVLLVALFATYIFRWSVNR